MRVSVSSKVVYARRLGAFLIIIGALFAQPLLQLNLPAVFASTTSTIIDESFDSFTGSNAPAHWTVSNTGRYVDAGICGNAPNCVQFDHTKNVSATLDLPLSASQKAKSLSFTLKQKSAGDTIDGSLSIEEFDGSTSVGAASYSTGATAVPLDSRATRIIFSTTANPHNNLALDDVAVTAETATAVTNNTTGVSYNTLEEAISAANAGNSLTLNENMPVPRQLVVSKALSLNGGGHTLTPNFFGPGTANSNNATIGILADNVTIQNLVIDGSEGTALHGINAYEVVGAHLDGVTLLNNDKYGLLVNGSTVTAHNVTTGGNGWGGVNVDQGSGVSQAANLTVSGTSSHTELAAIYVDNDTKNVAVNAPAYEWHRSGIPGREHDRAYSLKTLQTCNSSTFDSGFTDGSVDGQNGWKSTGNFDQAVVDNTYGYSSFGCKALRLSNGTASSSFGDQTYSAPAPQAAGESATNDHYEATFSFGSTMQSQQQNLAISVSPDDGSGNRMSYVGLADDASGTELTFYDTDTDGNFRAESLGTVSRSQAHTLHLVIDFKPGESNDVVKVYLDDALVHTGTTWEQYYRKSVEQAGNGNAVPTVDRLALLARGSSVSANMGNGYLFDNVNVSTTQNIPAPAIKSVDVAPLEQGEVSVTVTLVNDSDIDLNHNYTFVKFLSGRGLVGNALANSGKYGFTKIAPATYRAVFDSTDFVPTDSEGDYVVYISMQDTTKRKDWNNSHRSVVDNNAPTITNVTVDNPAHGTTNVDVTLDDSHGVLEDDRFTFVKFLAGRDITGDATANSTKYALKHLTGSTYRATVDTSEFAAAGTGRYVVYVSAQDTLGNKRADNSTRDIIVDNQAPTIPQVTSPSARTWHRGSSLLNSWTASTDSRDIKQYQVKYEFDTGPAVYRTVTGTSRLQTFSGSYQGAITISVRAQDGAGNWSAFSTPVMYHYDSMNPTTTIAAPTGVTDGTFTISGHAQDNLQLNRVYVQLVNREDGQRYGGTTISLITHGTQYDWSHAYDATTDNLPDGTYAAHVTVVDMAGNTSSAGWTSDFVVDNTAPTVTITAPAKAKQYKAGDITINGFVDDTAVGPVSVVFNGVTKDVAFETITRKWTAMFENIPAGQYTVTASARDMAGNVGHDEVADVPVSASTIDVILPVDPNEPSNTNKNEQDKPTITRTQTPAQQLRQLAFGLPQATAQVQTAGGADQTDDTNTAVLGDETKNPESNQSENAKTLAAEDKKVVSGAWDMFGLAWYWWLLILAGLGSTVYAVRRS